MLEHFQRLDFVVLGFRATTCRRGPIYWQDIGGCRCTISVPRRCTLMRRRTAADAIPRCPWGAWSRPSTPHAAHPWSGNLLGSSWWRKKRMAAAWYAQLLGNSMSSDKTIESNGIVSIFCDAPCLEVIRIGRQWCRSRSVLESHSKSHPRMKRISMWRIFMTRVALSFLIGVAGMYSSIHSLYFLTRFGGKSTGILKILTLGRCNKFCHQLQKLKVPSIGTFSVDFGVFLSSGHKSQWNIKT